MSESDILQEVPRLDLLRFLERAQERDLARTRRWIAAEEQRQAAAPAPPPPPPDWVITQGIGARAQAVTVHQGECWIVDKRMRAVSRDEALRLLGGGSGRACDVCRPDTALGVL